MMHPRWGHRLRLVVAVVLVLTALGGVGLVLLPEILRRIAITRLEAAVAIADIDVNLFSGRARVTRLTVGDSGGPSPRLAFHALDLRFARLPLFRGRLVLEDLTLDQPRLRVEHTSE